MEARLTKLLLCVRLLSALLMPRAQRAAAELTLLVPHLQRTLRAEQQAKSSTLKLQLHNTTSCYVSNRVAGRWLDCRMHLCWRRFACSHRARGSFAKGSQIKRRRPCVPRQNPREARHDFLPMMTCFQTGPPAHSSFGFERDVRPWAAPLTLARTHVAAGKPAIPARATPWRC
jgi:hypothetical protein